MPRCPLHRYYYRWVQYTNGSMGVLPIIQPTLQSNMQSLVQYIKRMQEQRQLLKARNLCPAKGNRSGYLLTLTITSTLAVVVWWLSGHWTARAMSKHQLPRRGQHHYDVMTGLGLALLWSANDCLADWSTFFIDIWKRRYSRPGAKS